MCFTFLADRSKKRYEMPLAGCWRAKVGHYPHFLAEKQIKTGRFVEKMLSPTG